MNPQETLNAYIAITRKEIVRFMRIWTQTLLPPVITQSLYFIIFGNFIGSRVGDVRGVDYVEFIVPGLVMMSIITSSFANVASSFFGSKFQKNIEELLVSPTPNWIIVAGYTTGGVVRGLLVGFIVFMVSFSFVKNLQVQNPFLVIIFAFLTAVVFSLAGLINGILAKKFDDIGIFPTFILTPLTYLGGVFYSILNLPFFWQQISKLNPVLYMIDGFRYSFYGFQDLNIYSSLMLLTSVCLVLILTNISILNKGIGLRS